MGDKSSRARRNEEEPAADRDVDEDSETPTVPGVSPDLELEWLQSRGSEVAPGDGIGGTVDSTFDSETDDGAAMAADPALGPSVPSDGDAGATAGDGAELTTTVNRKPTGSAGVTAVATQAVETDPGSAGPATDAEYESEYGVEIKRPAAADDLDRLADTTGEDTVREWAEEGMPIEAMGVPSAMERFRERKESPVPWDVERRNKESYERNISRERSPDDETSLPPYVRRVLAQPGRPLTEVRNDLDGPIEAALSDVIVHSGAQATAAVERVGAKAITVDNHVLIADSEPSGPAGGRMLAQQVGNLRSRRETITPDTHGEQFSRTNRDWERRASIRAPPRQVGVQADEFIGLPDANTTGHLAGRIGDSEPSGPAGVNAPTARRIRRRGAELADQLTRTVDFDPTEFEVESSPVEPADDGVSVRAGSPGETTGTGATATISPDVQALWETGNLQAKLEVSTPDEPAEEQAEAVASEVVSMDAQPEEPVSVDGLSNTMGGSKSSPSHDSSVRNLIQSLGGGSPLSERARSYFEPRFGRDLSDVRIHTGGTAHKAASAINARAFTTGTDIVFAEGSYDHQSRTGRKLLAHELTHVIQQTGGNQPARSVVHRGIGDAAFETIASAVDLSGDIVQDFYEWAWNNRSLVAQNMAYPPVVIGLWIGDRFGTAAANGIFFAKGLLGHMDETASSLGHIIQRATLDSAFGSEGNLFTGMWEGVVGCLEGYWDIIANADEVIGGLVDGMQDLMGSFQPDEMEEIGSAVGEQMAEQTADVAGRSRHFGDEEGVSSFWRGIGYAFGYILTEVMLALIPIFGWIGKVANVVGRWGRRAAAALRPSLRQAGSQIRSGIRIIRITFSRLARRLAEYPPAEAQELLVEAARRFPDEKWRRVRNGLAETAAAGVRLGEAALGQARALLQLLRQGQEVLLEGLRFLMQLPETLLQRILERLRQEVAAKLVAAGLTIDSLAFLRSRVIKHSNLERVSPTQADIDMGAKLRMVGRGQAMRFTLEERIFIFRVKSGTTSNWTVDPPHTWADRHRLANSPHQPDVEIAEVPEGTEIYLGEGNTGQGIPTGNSIVGLPDENALARQETIGSLDDFIRRGDGGGSRGGRGSSGGDTDTPAGGDGVPGQEQLPEEARQFVEDMQEGMQEFREAAQEAALEEPVQNGLQSFIEEEEDGE